jgi:hypothetical protein
MLESRQPPALQHSKNAGRAAKTKVSNTSLSSIKRKCGAHKRFPMQIGEIRP